MEGLQVTCQDNSSELEADPTEKTLVRRLRRGGLGETLLFSTAGKGAMQIFENVCPLKSGQLSQERIN